MKSDHEKTRDELLAELVELRLSCAELRRSRVGETGSPRAAFQTELRESERSFRELFEHVGDGVAVYEAVDEGADFVFKDINSAGARMGGMERADHLGRRVSEVYPGIEDLGLLAVLQQVWRTGEPQHHPLGEYRDERIALCLENYVFRLSSGEVVAVCADHTMRRHVEEKLRHSEQKMQAIVSSIADPMVIMDRQLMVTWASASAAQIFGRIVGRRCFEVFHRPPRTAPCEICPVERVLEDETTREHEMAIVDREGRSRQFWGTTAVAARDGEGRAVTVVKMLRDVTERAEAEARRQHLEQQLRQAQKMEAVGRLTGGVAHDFNNLLQGIIGFTDLAIGELPPGHPARDSLGEVVAASERAASLVAQLMAFSRRQTMRVELLDLNQVVAHLLKLLGRVIGEDVQLDWSPASAPTLVAADRGMVEQVLMNLAVNARDAMTMTKGGRLSIELRPAAIEPEFCISHPWARPGSFVALTVRDTGCGMDAKTQALAFEPFFTTKAPGDGSGLGLATVYGIVKQHRGLVDMSSAPGLGTAFTLYWPRDDGSEKVGRGEDAADVSADDTEL